jgi:3-hydroxybutyryl-CoA dehydratase
MRFPMVQAYRAEEWVGRTALRRVRLTDEMLDRFTELSGDTNSVHADADAARRAGHRGRVVHGMLLGSLVSSVLGVDLPGEGGLLQELSLSFRRPCHPGDEIEIRVKATELFESVQVLALAVRIVRADGTVLATGHARSGLVRP